MPIIPFILALFVAEANNVKVPVAVWVISWVMVAVVLVIAIYQAAKKVN